MAARRIPVGVLALSALAAGLLPLSGASAGTARPEEAARLEEAARPLAGDARIVHVLGRLGYGPRPGDVERVRKMGLANYIVLQLHPDLISDDACEKRLEPLDLVRLSAPDLEKRFPPPTPEERKRLAELLKQLEQAPKEEQAKLREEIAAINRKSDRYLPLAQLQQAKLIRATYSERQLVQVMTDFWFNHFNVDSRKGRLALLVPEYEEQVLRPRVLGRFRDLLIATAQSPAMLFYLDNWRSAAPEGAPVAVSPGRVRRRGGPRGLNENYARELMELHTLGVDGGYTQQDIIEVARCFTGWTIAGGGYQGRMFEFRGEMHDAGPKKVLDLRIGSGGGISDGVKVLDYLSRHPSTARFISTELCRRFVSDDPPPALVERCARTFLQTEGDIAEVLHTLFISDEFLDAAAEDAKVKKPHELLVSAVRALGIETDFPRGAVAMLDRLGEPLYRCEPPTGYRDTLAKWSGANEILNRINFALALSFGRLPGLRPDWARVLEGAPSSDAEALADWLCRRLLGRPLSPGTWTALEGAIFQAGQLLDRGQGRVPPVQEAAAYLTAAILGSPDFQRR